MFKWGRARRQSSLSPQSFDPVGERRRAEHRASDRGACQADEPGASTGESTGLSPGRRCANSNS